jgi:Flp pilus assembly pilin Flp
MLNALWNFVTDQTGATRLEAALIAAILGVALLDVLISRGGRLTGELSQVSISPR